MRESDFSEALLAWYDRSARVLPWRVGPAARASGKRPDPYHVWLSEIMLQQTTVAAVKSYFERFLLRWPDVSALAAAEDGEVMGEWAGLGYYARARNLLKCARLVATGYGGRFPESRAELLKLPGIGPYTSAAIAAIAFDHPETVVDGNVERVMARFHAVETPLPDAKPLLVTHADRLTPTRRAGDYAQALMDLGATICTPKSPTCGLCPVKAGCLARTGFDPAEFPRKRPKATKPTRYGIAYVARRSDGAWLLERRPDTGLLGGMLGWPGAAWGEAAEEAPPLDANWRALPGEVRHTFTHFHLRLSIKIAQVSCETKPEIGQFVAGDAFRRSELPTVMRKVLDLAQSDPLFH